MIASVNNTILLVREERNQHQKTSAHVASIDSPVAKAEFMDALNEVVQVGDSFDFDKVRD